MSKSFRMSELDKMPPRPPAHNLRDGRVVDVVFPSQDAETLSNRIELANVSDVLVGEGSFPMVTSAIARW